MTERKEAPEPEVVVDAIQTETRAPGFINPWTAKEVNRPLLAGTRVCSECGTESRGWTEGSEVQTIRCWQCKRDTLHRFRDLTPAQEIKDWFFDPGDAVRMMMKALGWSGQGNAGGWAALYDEHGHLMGKRHGYGAFFEVIAPSYQAATGRPLPRYGNPIHRELWRCAKCGGTRTVDIHEGRGVLLTDWHQCGLPW